MFDETVLEAQARAVMPVDSAHDWWHVRRVWRLAQQIARTEPSADMRVLQIAVFFHDVMPKRAEGGHALVSAAWLADALFTTPATLPTVCNTSTTSCYAFAMACTRSKDAEWRKNAMSSWSGFCNSFGVNGARSRKKKRPDRSEQTCQVGCSHETFAHTLQNVGANLASGFQHLRDVAVANIVYFTTRSSTPLRLISPDSA